MALGFKSLSKTVVWIILALLIVGLAGFGATNLSGTVRTVGHAGDQVISVDDYARELQNEIRAIQAQTGQALPMSQVQAIGLDQTVLARLVALASIDNEVAGMGISIGDQNLQQEILEIPAFRGLDGQFSRDSYSFALNQAGMNENDFETRLRAETARTLVQGAIIAGTRMPPVLSDTLTDYIGARRSFTWATLTAADLETPVPAPTPGALQTYYDAHPDDFILPETKRLSYVLMTPEMVLDEVQIDDAALRDRYAERSDEFNLPERRLVERLVFNDIASASSAKAQLEVNGTTFEALVSDRGLALTDIDLGDVTRDELRDAADDVFATDIGTVVGPLPSALGPALFRINGKLEARVTSFEEAEPELRAEFASDRARRLVESRAEDLNDLLAGGATLEELAGESDMEFGQIDWSALSTDGVGAYEDVRVAAAAVTEDDYPEILFTEEGGIFALELNETLPPRPEPFDQARDKVAAAWTLQQTEEALTTRAEAVIAELGADGDFADTGLSFRVENGLTRTAFLEGTPPDFMTQVFEMDKDDLRIIASDGTVLIARLSDTLPPEETAELTAMQDAIGTQLDQALSEALFQAFASDAQLRAKPQIDQHALNAVMSSFHQ